MLKKILVPIFVIMISLSLSSLYSDEKNSKDAEFYFNECKINLAKENLDKAVEYGEKAVQLNDKVAKYHLWLGKAYRAKARKSPITAFSYGNKFKEEWRIALELAPNDVEIRYNWGDFYSDAPVIFGGNMEKAKEQAAEIMKLHPLKGHMLYGLIFERDGDIAQAESHMEKAYQLHLDCMKNDPTKRSGFSPDVLNGYGYRLIRKKHMEKAIKYFKMNVDAFPDYFNTYDSLAEAYMNKGDTELAIKYYKKAMESNPQKTDYEKESFKSEQKHLKKLEKQLGRPSAP